MRCFECSGEVVERKSSAIFYRRDGLPVFFEDIPLGECSQCGEKYISGQVAERISDILENKGLDTAKRLSVPVVSLAA